MIEKYYNYILRKYHTLVSKLRKIRFACLPGIKIGKSINIDPNVCISTLYGGNISIGNNCILCRGCKLYSWGGFIKIGNNCSINSDTILYGQGGLTIGNNVRIAAQCVIIPSNHIYKSCNVPIFKQGLSKKGIIIEEDVWIGTGVRILDGVTIAKGCVIGAGTIVTKSTEPYNVYVGIPAKKLKSRL